MLKMKKLNIHNRGQSLISIIAILVVISSIVGVLYYYLLKEPILVGEETSKLEEGITVPSGEELSKERIEEEENTLPEENVEEELIIQQCPDGTLCGQCSINKPEYCESGNLINKASLCGCPAGYKTSNNSCLVEIPKFDSRPGLVVIRKGVSGENFAKEIASSKNWGVLSVDTSNHDQIKKEILNFYNRNKFYYLLLIGTNEEIPYAVYNSQKNLYKTDPSLYADINNDGFIELAIGRLPFSSEAELKKYFINLKPKGDFITFEHYPLSRQEDAEDEFTVREYGYAKFCLTSLSSNIRAYRNSNILDLVKHYRESAILELRTHGSDSSAVTGTDPLIISSFCKDYREFSPSGRPNNCELEYLSNRPIIIHMSCNNGKVLGRELIQNGASAFMGFYNESGYSPIVTQRILDRESVGEAMKNTYNSTILRYTYAEHMSQGPAGDIIMMMSIPNISGLNTYDITNFNQIKETPFDKYGFILYGDPSLKVTNFQKPDYNIDVEQRNNQIIITAKSPKLFDVSPRENVLCYMDEKISGASLVLKKYWPNSHRIMLTFSVEGVNKLKSQKVTVDNKEFALSGSEVYRINLLKGKTEEYLFISIYDSSWAEGKISRLDYTKDIQISIDYE
jgi:hypothetical protein